jgi:hypothetical protein
MDTLPRNPPTVDDVREFRVTGPWQSKSGGVLNVPVALPHLEAMRFFDYDPAELGRIPIDIRGLRVWVVSDIPAGGIGGNQFHRVRTEISFVVKGKVSWRFEDLYGGTRVISWSPDNALLMPPFVIHTLVSEESGSAVVTLANTLYIPDDPRTHDTYRADLFYAMRDRFRCEAGLNKRPRVHAAVG